MFRTFAKFRPGRLWRHAPPEAPANDNLPAALRPARAPRRRALVCHWSVSDDGTSLTCEWQLAPEPQGVIPAPRSRMRSQECTTAHQRRAGVYYRIVAFLAYKAGCGANPSCVAASITVSSQGYA